MHTPGTMHPPAVATALVASRSSLDGVEAALALPLRLGVAVIVLVWARLGHGCWATASTPSSGGEPSPDRLALGHVEC